MNTTNRAIDRHEPAILDVLDHVEHDGLTYEAALFTAAESWTTATAPLTPARLDSLVRVWCAIGGVEVPS